MKFAFLLMGDYDSATDRTSICHGASQMIGVRSIEDACGVATELYHQGIDCIELCGAFCEEGARRIMDVTEHTIPVGFVVHFEEQDALFKKTFG